ncbi:hypothetical protein GCM10023350_10860 [Nocardioides endophyticus]|uniref:Uncharacterized protein n=1 Tax=Nocardioides endophyticus TaxID=1353775 RepID=A0ABP8YJC7_9ACTN
MAPGSDRKAEAATAYDAPVDNGGFEARRWRASHLNHRDRPTAEVVSRLGASAPSHLNHRDGG